MTCPCFCSGGYKDKSSSLSALSLLASLCYGLALSLSFYWILIMERLWPLPVLATPLHKHGLEHFNTRVPGYDTVYSQRKLHITFHSFRVRVKCMSTLLWNHFNLNPETFCALRPTPNHSPVCLGEGESDHFYEKWPVRAQRAGGKKKAFFSSEHRTFCHWRPFKFNNGTFAHNASQHISLDSKLASHLLLLCASNTYTHMQMST